MNENLSRRLAFLGVLIIALFAALVTRAWHLQVLVAEELSDQAIRNHVEIIVTQPTRGRILDRHGVVLADNIRTGRQIQIRPRPNRIRTRTIITTA